jgi:hypothetical protein
MKIVAWKTDRGLPIRFSHLQIAKMSGMSEKSVKVYKRRYFTTRWNRAEEAEVLREVEVGHRDDRGRRVPGLYEIGKDYHQFAGGRL